MAKKTGGFSEIVGLALDALGETAKANDVQTWLKANHPSFKIKDSFGSMLSALKSKRKEAKGDKPTLFDARNPLPGETKALAAC